MTLKKLLFIGGLILPLLLCGATNKQSEKHSFEIGNKTFLLDKKPIVIKAAEMHYTRIPAAYWEHRIKMCKSLGMNAICIYAFWNIHEQEPDKFNFKDQNDIAEFCRIAQKHGMYIILRPGPYVCSEWEMGGLPWWLLKKEDINLRTNDAYFIDRTRIYMNELGKQLADLQITRGGNIIMVQVENEYGAYAVDKEYIKNIRDIVKEAGFTDIPLFQCDWSSTFHLNGLDDMLWTINFGTGANINAQFQKLREARPNSPLMCSEFWSGWFDHWGRRHETRDAETMISGIKDMLDQNISFSLYMTHGGTTFGHWGGANCPPYSAMCSSYDYDAPISEAGWATDKYFKLRNLLANYTNTGDTLPEVPKPYPTIEIPSIQFKEIAPIFKNLPKPKYSKEIKPMEYFNQGWGTILYRTTLPEIKKGTMLIIDEAHDWAQIFIDGNLIGKMDRRRGENSIPLPALKEGSRLDILVEAMGRVNFDRAIHDRKGITHKVEIRTDNSSKELKNWEIYSFPTDAKTAQKKKFKKGSTCTQPAYYRASFNLKNTGDVFLNMENWGKGMVWVNGKNIGRFWKIGPQQTLYMPGCWLKKGNNEIIVLDLIGPEKAEIEGLKKPILDVLHSEEPMTHRKQGETLNLTNETPVKTGSFATENGWQEIKFDKPVSGRYFCIEAINALDGNNTASIAEFHIMDKDGKNLSRLNWKIIYADSESTDWGNYTADKIYDLQESTYWSTANGQKFPHSLIIDLSDEYTISGFKYLPRAEEGVPGGIKDFKIYVKSSPFKLK